MTRASFALLLSVCALLNGCYPLDEMLGIGSFTISGTIKAHTFVPADSVDLLEYHWVGPGGGFRHATETCIRMSDPDASGNSTGTYTMRYVWCTGPDRSTTLTVVFHSRTAPSGATCTVDGRGQVALSGPPWYGPEEPSVYQFTYYAASEEPRNVTIDFDLGS